ncbi:hypothetical protein [Carboxylicivirga marina]|uniref:Uncharacterized protein n=2 Tax=Carboxylicivirga marina TaxID=2800988 RepID=A0ABS1HMK4_9BACT|nr:hypothetical protein [Carboxylicivirga marina]MBK3518905.1 hypothetical protein [Carboxylicivirga marina]
MKFWKVWFVKSPNASYLANRNDLRKCTSNIQGGERTKYEVGGNRFNSFSQNVSKMLKAGQSLEKAKMELYDEVRQNFASFLSANAGNQPYCYWWGPTNTHRSWV